MTIISPALLKATGIVTCGLSTRKGGASLEPFGMNLSFKVGDTKEDVQKNRELFFGTLGIREAMTASPVQVHGKIVQCANGPGIYPDCDGLISNVRGVYLCISVADCIPVFIVETNKQVVAAIHAGWRGTSALIAQEGVRMMVEEFGCNPERMVAYIGPGASACCYSVGQDVANKFHEEFTRKTPDKIFVDLKAANRAQLVNAGLSQNAIETSPHCTIGEPDVFHSFRRDKDRSGRMMGVIGLKAVR